MTALRVAWTHRRGRGSAQVRGTHTVAAFARVGLNVCVLERVPACLNVCVYARIFRAFVRTCYYVVARGTGFG